MRLVGERWSHIFTRRQFTVDVVAGARALDERLEQREYDAIPARFQRLR